MTAAVARYVIERLPAGVRASAIMLDGSTEPVVHRVFHSPTGFEYGYGGSGPADLARSILWHFLQHEPPAALYQTFKWDFIARPRPRKFEISAEEMRTWLAHQAATR